MQQKLFEPEYFYRTRQVTPDEINSVRVEIPRIADLCRGVVPKYFTK